MGIEENGERGERGTGKKGNREWEEWTGNEGMGKDKLFLFPSFTFSLFFLLFFFFKEKINF